MPVTIIVNNLTAVHQSSMGMITCGPPDVCKTPAPPAPSPVPIPYPNIAMSSDLVLGSMMVKADGASVAVKDCMFAMSTGDEAGVAGGIVSSLIKGPAKFIAYSMDVKFEGKNVARLGDPMTLNGNAPNTTGPAEVQANLVQTLGQETYDKLCHAFCWCNERGGGGSEGRKIVQPGSNIA